MAELGTAYVNVEGDFSRLKKQSKSGFGNIGAIAAKAFVAAFAAKKIFDFGASTVKAAEEWGTLVGGVSNLVAKQQDALGDAATLTTDHLVDQANALQTLTGMSNEQIMSGERMLLTFQGVQNEGTGMNAIFDRSTKVLADLVAAEAFSDMKSGAIQLGKALQDPEKGLTALSRAGVVFTQAQKDQVSAMVEAGDTAGAQKLILDELEKVYGGTAEAQRNSTDVIKNAWNDVLVVIGQALLPLLEKLADWIVDVAIPTLKEWWPTIVATGETLIGVFEGAWAMIEPVFDAFMGVYDMVVGIFEDNSEAIGEEMDATASWISDVWDQISEIFGQAMELISAIIDTYVAIYSWIWENFGDEIMATIRYVFDYIKDLISAALGIISGILDVFIGLFTGDWDRMADGARKILTTLWDFIKKSFTKAVDFILLIVRLLWPKVKRALGALLDGMIQFGKDMLLGMRDGVVSVAKDLFNAVTDAVMAPVNWVKDKLGIGSPSKLFRSYGEAMSEGMAIGVNKGAPDVTKAVEGLVSRPDAALSATIDTQTVRPAFGVVNNFHAPVGGSMASFAKTIAYEGAKELRFAYG